MKYINKISVTILSLFTFLACDNEDDNTGHSQVNYSKVLATVATENALVTINETAINEDDASTYSIPVTVSIKEVIPTDVHVNIVQIGGNANSEDYVLPEIVIPSGKLSASGNVEIVKNGYSETDETLILGAKAKANVNLNDFKLSITIDNDYRNHIIEFEMDWSGTYVLEQPSGSITIDYCKADFDLAIFDSNDNLIDYVLGTAACPEVGELSILLPDGTYYLAANLYENPLNAYGIKEDLDLRFKYNQEYYMSGEFTFKGFNIDDDDNGGNPPDPTLMTKVAKLDVKDGYIYTITPIEK